MLIALVHLPNSPPPFTNHNWGSTARHGRVLPRYQEHENDHTEAPQVAFVGVTLTSLRRSWWYLVILEHSPATSLAISLAKLKIAPPPKKKNT